MCFHITKNLMDTWHTCLNSCPRIPKLGRTQVQELEAKGQ